MTAVIRRRHEQRLSVGHALASYARQCPEQHSRIKEGLLLKRVISANSFWVSRRFILTKDTLSVLREDEETVIDFIPLLEIDAVQSNYLDQTRRSENLSSDVPDFGFGEIDLFSENGISSVVEECFEITTVPEGYNGRRTYQLRCTSTEECLQWVQAIESQVKLARQGVIQPKTDTTDKVRLAIKAGYDSPFAQGGIALAILANFVTSIIFAQTNPEEGTFAYRLLEGLDLGFTIFFMLELAVNMAANWFTRFWKMEGAGWNYFDVVVVTISVFALALDDLPGLSSIRLVRVFRVVRLFERLQSLRKIISALSAAILPVTNALMVLLIVTGIYAVIGVGLFKEDDQDSFGNFSKALFTMFQVLTGDSWASVIARPMFVARGGNSEPSPMVVLFFVSYILVCGMVLLNVVIAVLLDEFITAVENDKQRLRKEAESANLNQNMNRGGALDPLLLSLSNFKSQEDLSTRIFAVYKVLDVDDSGGLNCDEMAMGFRRLNVQPPIHFSADDFDVVTEGGALCNARSEVDAEQFECMIRAQLKRFMERQMALRMGEAEQSDSPISTVLFCLKHIMFTLDQQGLPPAECFSRTSSCACCGSSASAKQFDALGTRLPDAPSSRLAASNRRDSIRLAMYRSKSAITPQTKSVTPLAPHKEVIRHLQAMWAPPSGKAEDVSRDKSCNQPGGNTKSSGDSDSAAQNGQAAGPGPLLPLQHEAVSEGASGGSLGGSSAGQGLESDEGAVTIHTVATDPEQKGSEAETDCQPAAQAAVVSVVSPTHAKTTTQINDADNEYAAVTLAVVGCSTLVSQAEGLAHSFERGGSLNGGDVKTQSDDTQDQDSREQELQHARVAEAAMRAQQKQNQQDWRRASSSDARPQLPSLSSSTFKHRTPLASLPPAPASLEGLLTRSGKAEEEQSPGLVYGPSPPPRSFSSSTGRKQRARKRWQPPGKDGKTRDGTTAELAFDYRGTYATATELPCREASN